MRLPSVLTQPIAADHVADALTRVSVSAPLNGVIEIAGPDPFRLDELVRLVLLPRRDSRQVITDPRARHFGAQLDERALVPAGDVLLGATRLDDWLHQPSLLAQR